MLSYLGILFKLPMALCGYNQGIILPITTTYYELKDKRVDISYNKLQEIKLCATFNRSKILNKSTLVDTMGTLYNVSYAVVQEEV